MANRQFYQFLYSANPMLTYLQGQFNVGATGAVSSVMGSGILNIVRVATGTYRINLENNYNKFLMMTTKLRAPTTGADVAVTAITPGVVYQIQALGTTTQAQWQTAGVPVGVTAAVGLSFVAAATSAGTGQVRLLGIATGSNIQVIGNPNLSIISTTNPHIIIQCLAATSSSVTTNIPSDPADGSVLMFDMMLRNSSLPGKGE